MSFHQSSHAEALRDAAKIIRNYEGGCTYPELLAAKLDAMADAPAERDALAARLADAEKTLKWIGCVDGWDGDLSRDACMALASGYFDRHPEAREVQATPTTPKDLEQR